MMHKGTPARTGDVPWFNHDDSVHAGILDRWISSSTQVRPNSRARTRCSSTTRVAPAQPCSVKCKRSTSLLVASKPNAERIKSSRKDGRSGAVAHPLHDDWVRRVDLHANVRYEGPCRDRVATRRVGRYLVIYSREAHRSSTTRASPRWFVARSFMSKECEKT